MAKLSLKSGHLDSGSDVRPRDLGRSVCEGGVLAPPSGAPPPRRDFAFQVKGEGPGTAARPPAALLPVSSRRVAYLAVSNACLLQGDLGMDQRLPALVAAHLPEAGLLLYYQKLL